ncbi:MAG: IS110 family transposase [Proteobacteria bacterium]|nr:IS110 family transposase [Desulfocapsa sp.]MBU4043599.1 IS110 family transposase [Pseudomonadota bacterium]MBU4586316.1 IS110 family transposase [Pseudomonadota bacterium]MCG2742895.1 IS110 family transposase [Desulfobacteraceae bacterium]MDP3184191.1 IS110 family transposase [Anaerolineales bacterium]
METIYYIGLDIHKKVIAYCIKTLDGHLVEQGKIDADRTSLIEWVNGLPGPWVGAMEATIFTGWIYDFLTPFAVDLKVAHPEMLKAITAAKKKNDRADAEMIADLLRVNLLPQCHMLPEDIRELRRILRYRNHVVRTAVKMQNKMSGLLMEVGASYSKRRLHGKKYFHELLERVEEIPPSVKDLLKLSRASFEMFRDVQKRLIAGLRDNDLIRERVRRLMTIQGVGEVTALTWALEIGDPLRFASIRQAISYCGLCSAQKESAGKEQRGPISKKRNKHLQTMLIEAAKIAPIWNPQLAVVHERELMKGNRNRATLAVARRLVAYMMAVDKAQTDFILHEEKKAA